MPAAPNPLDERERLAALHSYRVLDTDPERATDDLVRLAAGIAATPIAMISLVDRDRQWFKARVGLDACEMDRDVSFCAWTILQRDPMVVADAQQDPRFMDNPIVSSPPGIRFYAGFPLWAASGHCLGSLCVVDQRPRTLSPDVQRQLERLARCVVDQLEARRTAMELADALERVRLLGDLVPVCAYCRKVREDDQYRRSLEAWLDAETGARVTHGICPGCAQEHFPEWIEERG